MVVLVSFWGTVSILQVFLLRDIFMWFFGGDIDNGFFYVLSGAVWFILIVLSPFFVLFLYLLFDLIIYFGFFVL